MKKLKIVLKKFYEKYFINLDFFDYFEKSFFILFIIVLFSTEIESEPQIFLLKIVLVSITFWVMVWTNDKYYKNKNFANPKKELATMLRESLKHDIPLIFSSTLFISLILSSIDNKPIGIFLGLINYEKLDSDLYKFSFNGFYFFISLVFSLFFVFVILYLLSYLYLDMKYLIPERGGFSKREYNLRCRRLEDIIKTCTNEKKLKEFLNFINYELNLFREDSSLYFAGKHKHNRESMLLLLYKPALKKFLTKYRDKPKFEKVVINLHNEIAKRFSIEKEKGFEY